MTRCARCCCTACRPRHRRASRPAPRGAATVRSAAFGSTAIDVITTSSGALASKQAEDHLHGAGGGLQLDALVEPKRAVRIAVPASQPGVLQVLRRLDQ